MHQNRTSSAANTAFSLALELFVAISTLAAGARGWCRGHIRNPGSDANGEAPATLERGPAAVLFARPNTLRHVCCRPRLTLFGGRASAFWISAMCAAGAGPASKRAWEIAQAQRRVEGWPAVGIWRRRAGP